MRKRLFTFYAVLFGSINFLSAQITFQKTIGGTAGDYGMYAHQTTDGGYIITGFTESFGAGEEDVFLIKTDMNGNTMWSKTFGDTTQELGYSVQQTSDGGYIIVGITQPILSAINAEVYLIKTDVNGDTLWTRKFGALNADVGESVQQTTDGGYIIAGITGYGAGSSDVYLIKIDASGNSTWAKTYGGNDADFGYFVRQTSDGGYIITGTTESFGAGDIDVYLIKTDSIGNAVWSKAFGGSNDDLGRSVYQTTDGGYIIAGTTHSFGTGVADAYVIKTDSSGDTLWTKTYGGTYWDQGASACQTSDGGYLITGQLFNCAYLIKTNSTGDTLWTKAFIGGNSAFGKSVWQTADGGYFITGLHYHPGTSYILCLKTDSSGIGGCTQANQATIVTYPATQVTSPLTTVFSAPVLNTACTVFVGSGGTDSTLCSTVGINELTKADLFLISPNPSLGNFNLLFDNRILNGKVEILNILGAKVFAENIFNESKKEITLKNISSGIYFVKVFDEEKYYCKKIIIERD